MHDLEAHIFRQEQAAAVRKAVGALAPRQRVVIAARFGLDGAACTLDDTALELAKLDGYTVGRERIRQIECLALRRLKVHGGLHEVAGVKNPAKTLNAAEFSAHQQALKAQREKVERWLAAQQRAAQARRDAEDFAAQQRATPPPSLPPWRAAVAALGLFAWPEQSPSNHYDWMQRAEDLARWCAGGPPINPFDWMKS